MHAFFKQSKMERRGDVQKNHDKKNACLKITSVKKRNGYIFVCAFKKNACLKITSVKKRNGCIFVCAFVCVRAEEEL